MNTYTCKLRIASFEHKSTVLSFVYPEVQNDIQS